MAGSRSALIMADFLWAETLSPLSGFPGEAKGEGKMMGIKKSTDAGLSTAERKSLRVSEAQEAMSDHDDSQKAFQENRERLREARLAREALAGPMLYPAPGLPDETPIDNVRFSTRIRSALNAAGLKTVGEIREASDATLLSLRDLGAGSIARLRETLGLPPPARALRPKGKKPT
jgi:DNA-directed RNA polymerase alpha subunit